VKVALLHNPRSCADEAALIDDAFEEEDAPETIDAIIKALQQLGAQVEPVVADAQLPWRLAASKCDLAFNMAEGRGRRCREALGAAVCELLTVPFTGSDSLTLGMTLDKAIARRVVSPEVPVAPAVLIENGRCPNARLDELRYPVIVKPNDEGSSKGVRETPSPIANDPASARTQCEWLFANYGCPALVEEFLSGPEVTIGIVGNGDDLRLLGMMEVSPAQANGAFVYSVEAKREWRRRVRYDIPPRLGAAQLAELDAHARSAYRLLGCRDVARLDFRFDAVGRPHFLECNPLPGLHPVDGDLVLLSRDRLPYDSLVQSIALEAMRRLAIPLP
jgi:D-alanine-D-alanine ligase